MLSYQVAQLVSGVFPAQECLFRLAMVWAPEKLSNLGMNLNTCLMESISLVLAPFLLNRTLFLLTIRLLGHLMRNRHGKQPNYNIPLYPELPLLLCQKFELSLALFCKLNTVHLQVKGG
jgi:hypothetical protein